MHGLEMDSPTCLSVSIIARATLCAAILGVSGCVAGKEGWKYQSDAPGSWRADSANSRPLDVDALRTWWRGFNDPVLSSLIDRALAASPDLAAVRARIDEARGERGVAISGLLPSANLGASDRIERRDNQSTGVVSRTESWNVALDMSWEIDLFGRQQQNVKAASSDVAERVANFHAAQASLGSEVAIAYFNLRGAEAQLAVLNQNIATRAETTDITRWKAEAGIGTGMELEQALSTLEQARAAIPQVEQTIAQTRNQLAVLCGDVPGALDARLSRTKSLPKAPAAIGIGVPSEALANRPDVRAAEDTVVAAYHRKNAAVLERLPTINLSGSLGMDAIRSGAIFSPESAARTLAGNLVASLAQPVFEGGRITSTIRIQESRVEQAVANYQSVVLTALSEVENALIALRRTRERLAILEKANRAASEAARLAATRYEVGDVDLLTVLETQRTQLSLEEQQVNTRAEHLIACVQLYKALGGGWTPIKS